MEFSYWKCIELQLYTPNLNTLWLLSKLYKYVYNSDVNYSEDYYEIQGFTLIMWRILLCHYL